MMIELIQKTTPKGNERFSIIIPTWNNLSFLELCIHSIRQNSTFNHQIIVHVNEGIDGTLDWLQKEDITVTFSKENVGVCWALNAMRPYVNTEYIVFVNDDMYVCPGWDSALMDEIVSLPDNKFFLSSTLIQPKPFWCKAIISPADFGQSVDTFDEQKLLSEYNQFAHSDWSGGTWPLNIVHRDMWDLVGGYSIEFSPGLYSDPDFSAKLWMAGVRYFKGIGNSRVYHFEAKSTERVAKNKGSRQFLNKWGITSSVFMKQILKRGAPWTGRQTTPELKGQFKKEIIRSRFKRWYLSFKDTGAVKRIF